MLGGIFLKKLHIKFSMLLSFSIIVTATIGLVFQNLILVNVGYDKGTLTLIIGISILSVSSIILINNFIIKGISWRIAGLVNHINNIKKGDFGTTTPIKQKDEIGDLHKSINELSISLLELKEKEKELNFHRSYDPVTGLPNRSHLYEKLIHLKAENKTNFIIMLDIVDVKLNFTLFAHFLFTHLLKKCSSDFSSDDFPLFRLHG